LEVHRSIGLQVVFGSSVMMIMGASLVYPVLPVVAVALDIPISQIGLVLTAFTLPAIFLAPIGGMLMDLRGRKQVLVFGLLLYGVAGMLISFAPSLQWVLALRAVQGIGYAAIMPLVVVIIGDMFSKEKETIAQGMKVVLDRITLLVLPAAAGILAGIAWQAPFLLYGLAIPLGLAAARYLPEPLIERRAHAPGYIRDVLSASFHLRSVTIFSMSSLRFFIEMSFFVYLPIFAIDKLNMTVSRGGLLFTVFAVGAILTAVTVGSITRRFERIPLVIVSFILQGVCLLAASFADSVWAVGIVMLGFGLANGIISPAQKSLMTQSVTGSLRGGFVAVDRVAQNTAKSLAPPIAGTIVAFTSIETMFQAMGALAIGWALTVMALELAGMIAPPVQQAKAHLTDADR
jgi:MFS family permease